MTSPFILIPKPQSVRGFIAIFDILGFKSFCKNNTDTKVSENVIGVIDGMQQYVQNVFKERLCGNNQAVEQGLSELLSPTSWQVFSDTFIITSSHREGDRADPLAMFMLTCATLNQFMFLHGLPVGGAIYYGDYLRGEKCLAGKVIVEALDQLKELEAACTVMSDDSFEHLTATFQKVRRKNMEWDIYRIILDMLPRCPIPCKMGTRNLAVLNWFSPQFGFALPGTEELETFVTDKFSAHNKTLEESAVQKARNTVELFKSWRSRQRAETANDFQI